MKDQIEALQDTYDCLIKAHTAYTRFLLMQKRVNSSDEILPMIADASRRVTTMCEKLTVERDKQNERLYGNGVLRVTVYAGKSPHCHSVTVQRPDNTSDLPYITEAAYNALCFTFGTKLMWTRETFNVNVIAPSGRIVEVITSPATAAK